MIPRRDNVCRATIPCVGLTWSSTLGARAHLPFMVPLFSWLVILARSDTAKGVVVLFARASPGQTNVENLVLRAALNEPCSR